LTSMSDAQKYADITFLALVLWREARGESLDVRKGIANVILNRVAKPCWWGEDAMSVCFKKWQFSSLTDPNDKQLTTWPRANLIEWQECLLIAMRAIDGELENTIKGADSYYDVSINAPKWAAKDCFVCQIGKIKFYDTNHDNERI
jgi:N-acetylmuramoyl-L-alanine amidase